ncbi:MAG: protein-disulfide reductase DsbD domain-containing protein, partial [Verrucomicrobiales bacterium]
GYHTYWQNPGIVGMPTTIDWTLPKGFSAGPIQWPAPEEVDMSGHPAHGYHRDVLLLVEITPPTSLDTEQVSLVADIRWMACSTSCHPGRIRKTLSLPVSKTEPSSSHAERFHRARESLPRPREGWKSHWFSSADEQEITLVLSSPQRIAPPVDAYFFSTDGQISSSPPQKLQFTREGKFELHLKRSEFSPEPNDELPGILRLRSINGESTFIQLAAQRQTISQRSPQPINRKHATHNPSP